MKRVLLILAIAFLLVACSSEEPEVVGENVSAINNLGFYYASQGDDEKAKSYFHQALEMQYDHEVARKNLALIYYQEKNFTAAEEQFRVLTQLWPENPQYHYNLALAITEQCRVNEDCRLDEAIAEFNASNNIEPGYERALQNIDALRVVQEQMNSSANLSG